jgi:ribose-phosphate pyrophosphokinase
VDDMIDTGSTLALAARSLKENGASRTYALVSHGACSLPLLLLSIVRYSSAIGLFSEVSMSVIENLPLETLVVCIHFMPNGSVLPAHPPCQT